MTKKQLIYTIVNLWSIPYIKNSKMSKIEIRRFKNRLYGTLKLMSLEELKKFK